MTRLLIALATMTFVSLPHADADVPWAEGVPPAKQEQAEALFAEANQLFAQLAHAPALEKYQAAIALWDHPMIRFNMAVTLIRLDRILEADEALERALRFGNTPFTPQLHQQALDYQRLVAGRVGTVEASCEQSGAQVALDGKPWFQCPGKHKVRVLSGEHTLLGDREGYLTRSRKITVAGGATVSETVTLVPIESAVRLEYPYQRWVPWTITGGGVAIALSGLGVWLTGRSNMEKFDAEFSELCPKGCVTALIEKRLAEDRDRARLQGSVGITMIAAGSATAVAGIVLVILNRPKRILPSVEVMPGATGGMTATVGWHF